MIDGRVVGTWRRTIRKSGIEIAVSPFTSLGKADKGRFAEVAQRYGEFLGSPVTLL